MPHPEIDNQTPFAFEALFVADENLRPLLAPIVKACFDIGGDGKLELSEEQRPIDFVGAAWGEPGESSLRLEPETAFTKPGTDAVLIGHAHAPRLGTSEVQVSFQVGPLVQSAIVCGDRQWQKRLIGSAASDPLPFERLPLVWERAFGGWDRSHEDPDRHDYEPRNPVGCGFRAKRGVFEEGAMLPNIEAPDARLARYRGSCPPVGFGFVSPNWEPRRGLAGTYDEGWDAARKPFLPLDFDRRFFHAAPPELTSSQPLRGDEAVSVLNASPEGRVDFQLPGVHPPRCLVSRRNGNDETLETHLDTIIVDLEERQLVLLWRNFTLLSDGPLDVNAIEISAENAPEPRGLEVPASNVVPLFDEASA